MDAMVRAELIDLMARILMEVFQAEGGNVDDRAAYTVPRSGRSTWLAEPSST